MGLIFTENEKRRRLLKRRTGPFRYIEVVMLTLLGIPIGVLLTFVLSFLWNIPTPGLYAMKLIPDRGPGEEWFTPLISRFVVAGFVNVVCCCVITGALAAVVRRLRRLKEPARPSVRS
jgi:hypothetical protein